MKHKKLFNFSILVCIVLSLPVTALAHNCSGLSDCHGTIKAALLAILAIALLIALLPYLPAILSALGKLLNLIGIVEAATGRSVFTGAKLRMWERLLGITPFGKLGKIAPKIAKVKVGDRLLPATSEMSVQSKLFHYLLDPAHPVGGPKAKFFSEALGFTRNNMDDLARQIKFDPARAVQVAVTAHGPKYSQIIEVVGANGRRINVEFGWIRNEDGIVRLITGYPAKR